VDHHQQQLAAACFAVGVAALLWVFRRTLLRSRGPGGRDDITLRTRHLAAGAEIDEISAREWLHTWRSALKFQRGAAALTPEQQQWLAGLSAWQAGHRRTSLP
jgi:hypothetical protein